MRGISRSVMTKWQPCCVTSSAASMPSAASFHAVAVLFQHAADELAHADGIVRDDDEAFLLDAVDSFGRYGSACHGSRTRREDARGAGAGLQRPAFRRLVRNHAIQIDQKNKAAVRGDCRTGKSFTRRRYSPRFLMTISSLPRTSSTTKPIWRLPAFATTMRK